MIVLLAALSSAFNPAGLAKDKDKEKKVYTGTAVMWREPTDIESRNLLLGAGGEEMKPDISSVTFVEEKTGGYSKKFLVPVPMMFRLGTR